MKKLLVLVLIVCHFNLFSQENSLELKKDSLWNIWLYDSFSSEEKYSAIDRLCNEVYLKLNPDSAQIISKIHFIKAESSNNFKEMGVAKINEAMSFGFRGELDTALFISSEALTYSIRANDVKNESYIHYRIGALTASLGRFNAAISSLQTSAALSIKIEDKKSVAITYSTLAEIYRALDNDSLALTLINQVIEIETELDQISSSTYTTHGSILEQNSDYQGAMNSYKLAIREARKKRKDMDIARAQSNLSHLYVILGELEFSKECAKETIEIYKKLNYTLGLPHGYVALGNVLVAQDSISEGLIWHEKAIAQFEKLKDQFSLYEVLSIKAYDLFALKRFEESIELCTYLLEKDSKNIKGSLNKRIVFSQLSDCYFELENFELALKHGLHAHELAISESKIKSKFQTTQDLYRIYKALGNNDLALEFHEKYIEYDNKLKEKENDKELIKSKYQMDYEKQALQDSLNFKLRNQLLIAHGDSQKRAITISSAGILLLVGLSFLLFTLLRKNRKQKEAVSNTLKQNTILLKEKDTLLREIHHRVKNNLQVISSLLSWQSRETFDKKAKSALTESQARVQSMSLIHQNLYQKDNLTGIDMKPYIDNLSQYLISTYSVSENISFTSEIEDLRLDVDTVVPLGLIINELITNSIKYAFNEDKAGTILIKLSEENGKIHLSVKDNGIGITGIESLGGENSFGYSLIKAFSQRLEADLIISGDNGTEVKVIISDYIKR